MPCPALEASCWGRCRTDRIFAAARECEGGRHPIGASVAQAPESVGFRSSRMSRARTAARDFTSGWAGTM